MKNPIVTADGVAYAWLRRQGQPRSPEVKALLAERNCTCKICNRPFGDHDQKDFDAHIDKILEPHRRVRKPPAT